VYKQILVATDGSDTSSAAVTQAAQLALALKARLRIFHAVTTTPWAIDDADGRLLQQLLDQLRSTGESIVHEAARAVRAQGVETDTRLVEALGDEAGRCIVQEAVAWPADLVVCGTHGRRGIRRLLMGSDAEYVVRHGEIPVLLVRAVHKP
jgi:nucleotide-binding universal stress UspA family protein